MARRVRDSDARQTPRSSASAFSTWPELGLGPSDSLSTDPFNSYFTTTPCECYQTLHALSCLMAPRFESNEMQVDPFHSCEINASPK